MNILFTSEEVVEICNGKYYSRNLGQHLTKYKYLGEIICVCYSKEVQKTSLPEIIESGVEFVFCLKENSLSAKFKYLKQNRDIIRECLAKVDALVCHIPSTISYHAIALNKRYHKPYMGVVVGCAWDALWNYDWRGKLLALPCFLRMRRVVKKLPYAIYVTKEFLQQRYPCKGVIVHASNVCIYDTDSKILSQRLQCIENRQESAEIKVATTAAIDVRYKGQQYVIKAISLLNNKLGYKFHYYIIGGGDKTYLENVAKQENVEQFVHFVGSLPYNEVVKKLDGMDIYIQPSKQEGLPRALIEAMSRALPALGSKVAGIPELLLPQFIFEKGNVDAIVRILSSFNKEMMQEQAKINFATVKEYRIEIINNRRNAFFDVFLNSIS